MSNATAATTSGRKIARTIYAAAQASDASTEVLAELWRLAGSTEQQCRAALEALSDATCDLVDAQLTDDTTDEQWDALQADAGAWLTSTPIGLTQWLPGVQVAPVISLVA